MSKQSKFLRKIYDAGIAAGLTDSAARVMAAQAALESSYGSKAPGNNLFGIKAGKSWKGDVQYLNTWEGVGGNKVKIKDKFRKYGTLEEGIADRIAFMDKRYPGFNTAASMDEAYKALKLGESGAYATDGVEAGDPLTYADKLNLIGGKITGEPPIPPGGMLSDPKSWMQDLGFAGSATANKQFQDAIPKPLTKSENFGGTPVDMPDNIRAARQGTLESGVIEELNKLMKNGIVVPDGTRDIKAIASQAIDMPSADLIAAGVYASGLVPPPKSTSVLPKVEEGMKGRGLPTPVAAPVYPTVEDYGTKTVKAPNLVSPQSTAATLLPMLAASQVVKAVTQPQAAAAAPEKPKATGSSTKGDGSAPMTPGDQRLEDLIKAVTKPSVIATGQGIAGTAELPKDYKPSPSVYPTADPPKKTTVVSSPLSSNPKPVSVSKVTGALDNAPVSLSNPVIKQVTTTTPVQTASVTQTNKAVSQDLLKQVEDILAEPSAVQPKYETGMLGRGQPAISVGTAALDVTPDQATAPAKKATVTTTKAAEAKPLDATVAIQKTLTPAGKSVVQSDLKDLTDKPATGAAAKVGGAVTQTKGALSPLDIMADLAFGGGEMTMGLIGDALSGKATRDTQEAINNATLSKIAAGVPVTKVAAAKAQLGLSSADAYDYVNQKSKSDAQSKAAANNGGKVPGQSSSGRTYNMDTNTWE